MPIGLFGSTGSDQSMRLVVSHCLSLPFWYNASSRSRPSSYSQLNRADPFAGTSHVVVRSMGLVYFSAVLMGLSTLRQQAFDQVGESSRDGLRRGLRCIAGENEIGDREPGDGLRRQQHVVGRQI